MTRPREITPNLLDAVKGRFWSKAVKSPNGDCLEWRAARARRDYGKIEIEGQWWPAHRIAYALAKSIPSPDKIVRHSCDNPRCVNPDHLDVGDDWANAQDRKNRGREPDRRGEANGRCRLDTRTVTEIRASRARHVDLARRFQVSPSTIRDIRSGRRWGHVQ